MNNFGSTFPVSGRSYVTPDGKVMKKPYPLSLKEIITQEGAEDGVFNSTGMNIPKRLLSKPWNAPLWWFMTDHGVWNDKWMPPPWAIVTTEEMVAWLRENGFTSDGK